MFARTVTINGKDIVVFCTPETPISEVLYRAAGIALADEKAAQERDPVYQGYRREVRHLWSGF